MSWAELRGAALGLAALLALPVAPVDGAAPARRLVAEGVVVYLEPGRPGSLTLSAWARAGRSTAPAGQGAVADLAAAWMRLGGSRSLPGGDFALACRALGATVEVSADRDLLRVVMRVPGSRVHAGLRLFADLIMYPAFGPEVEAEARRVAREEGALGDLALARAVAWAGAGEAPWSAAPAGREPSRDEVVAFHRDRVGADTVFVAVEGDWGGLDPRAELDSAFLGFRRAAAPYLAPAASGHRGGSAVIASRATAAGKARLLLARAGRARGDGAWLETTAALVAMAGEAADRMRREAQVEQVRLTLEQPIGLPDVVLVEVLLPEASVSRATAVWQDAWEGAARVRLPAAQLESARRSLSRGLVPPPDAIRAATAYALLEALGAPAAEPGERSRQLASLSAAQVARALAGVSR